MTTVQNRLTIRASWGDADPAGLIYYPNYFDWFDQCYQALLESVGFTQRVLRSRWGIVGTGVVDASGQFRSPVGPGDILEATSFVERWSERSFTVYHRFDNGTKLAAEGREVRGWFTPIAGETLRITADPIPEDFKSRLGWAANGG